MRLAIAISQCGFIGWNSVAPWPDVNPMDDSPNNRPQKIPVPAGLYTIERLSHFIMEEIPGLTLKMNKATGLIKLNIPESSGMMKLTGDLHRILGIDERR